MSSVSAALPALLVSLLLPVAPLLAAPLAPDVVPLAAAGPAGGVPTALAAADLDGKARAAILKACPAVDAELLATSGLGQSTAGVTTYCTAVGVTPLATASDVGECLIRHHTCRVGQLLDDEAPRARELLEIGGIVP